jgi:hypothetical protein
MALCTILYTTAFDVCLQAVAEIEAACEQRVSATVAAAELQVNAAVQAADVSREVLILAFTATNSELQTQVSSKTDEV